LAGGWDASVDDRANEHESSSLFKPIKNSHSGANGFPSSLPEIVQKNQEKVFKKERIRKELLRKRLQRKIGRSSVASN
jgi:hypothetical protein